MESLELKIAKKNENNNYRSTTEDFRLLKKMYQQIRG